MIYPDRVRLNRHGRCRLLRKVQAATTAQFAEAPLENEAEGA